MNDIILKQCSSLEKIFLNDIEIREGYTGNSVLRGEEISYQIAFKAKEERSFMANVSIDAPKGCSAELYLVENVPCSFPIYPFCEDEDYITKEPGLFPDLLLPVENKEFLVSPYQWRSIWVTLKTSASITSGNHTITVTFKSEKENVCESICFDLSVIDAEKEPAERIFTQWFYADCIADAHKVEIFSQRHWELIESYIKMAGENGINMLLTPVLTPPLDTEVGAERPTVQLVDVFKEGECYRFGYEKLERWIGIMQRHNVKYIEISHLFTQWGAKCAPKVIAEENGKMIKLFGWETEATSNEYSNFLSQFIPSLRKFLSERGLLKNTYFHISDEPNKDNLESYLSAKEVAQKYLEGCNVIDALSSLDFYKKGVVKKPVVATTSIEKFIGENVPDLWAYYCCSQFERTANRFLAMPSYRNRILGVQLYRYNIQGFLHWGYNFYYSQLSRFFCDPHRITDSYGGFPGGDAFIVYPGEDCALPSLRLKVFYEMIQDVAALEKLEKLVGRDEVIRLIDETAGEVITFKSYPRNSEFLLKLRRKVNEQIENKSEILLTKRR